MQYEEFVARVQKNANLDTPEEAAELSIVFLATLAEPLGRLEVKQVASQLPRPLNEAFFQTSPPETSRWDNDPIRLEHFYNRMKSRLDVSYTDAAKLSQAVAKVLKEAISAGEYQDMVKSLPDDWRALFS